ncbi:polar tube protein 4 (PTP4) [Vairimorpha necatrix]|uniref:Polar tube protein 4 (PTP4) n=1 Tax=Vairimorpha necatrix TaxID=6039 RepID=A0AAX4JF05_9MICR
MIFLFIFRTLCEYKELDEFINKDIKIYFAGYPTTFLGILEDKSELFAENKYLSFEKIKFNPKCRIIKRGSYYELLFSNKKMCKTGNRIAQCSTPENWEITRKNFGYTISKNDYCITKDIDDTLKMQKCVDTDDQLFSFKPVAADCNPESKLNDEHSVHVNLISDGVQKYTINNINPVSDEFTEEFTMDE